MKRQPRDARELVGLLADARTQPRMTVGQADGDLDLGRMVQLLDLDESSLLVHAQAGIRMGALEEQLNVHQMTLGWLPPTSRTRSLGAALAAPRPTEATPRGRLVDACAAIDGVLPGGTLFSTRLAPRRATGPDLMSALIGARGATGIVTGAWLRCFRRPPAETRCGFLFPSGETALVCARTLLQTGALPADLTILGQGDEFLLELQLGGTAEMVAAERTLAADLARAQGAREADGVPTALSAADRAARPAEFIPVHELSAAFAARPRPELAVLLPSGGALCSDAPVAVRLDPLATLTAELQRQLGPEGQAH